MSDFIKREDAKDAVINVVGRESIARYLDEMSKHFSTKDNDYYDALMDAEDAIDDLPSADVAPVRHGWWQITDAYPHNVYCSECHTKYAQTHWGVWEDGSLPRRYCPCCGSKMDEEVEA